MTFGQRQDKMVGVVNPQKDSRSWVIPVALASLILWPRPASAQARFVLDTTSARLSFHAGSSLGDFEGTAHDRSGWVEATDLKSLRGAHGEVRVAVASIRTGIGMRDGHLRSDMQATQFPWFIVQVDSVHADPGTPGRAELFSRITFRGQSRARIMAAELRASDDSIAARGSFPMTFSEFGFKPPVRMLGLTKVKDAWQIFFDLRFVRAQQ